MSKLLFLPLLLFFSGCFNDSVDTSEIANIFKKHSYAEYDPARLAAGLKNSGVSALEAFDPHAVFFHSGWKPEMPRPGGGKAGVGLALWKTDGAFLVVKVFPGSPAEASGIRAGDRITLVDGKEAAELPDAVLDEALYGAIGGVVRFKGERRGGGELNGSLKREYGGMPTVWGFNIPGAKTGYLRIVEFSGKASARVRAEVNDLLDGGAAQIVIDLRHNYGGSLGELANTLALFSTGKGTVFTVVSRHPGYSKVFTAQEPGPFAGVKTLLLDDSGTSSRAEIFAATLREWHLASVFGEVSAGNIALTRGFRLKDGGALRITVAHLLTPSGADLDGKGVPPDVPLNAQPPGSQAPIGEFPPAVASADPLIRRALGI